MNKKIHYETAVEFVNQNVVPLRFDSSDFAAFMKAMTIEEMSLELYQDKARAAETGNEAEKQIFLRPAGEEQKHFRIMENIVEFVSRPEPGNWLENAEWHHLKDD